MLFIPNDANGSRRLGRLDRRRQLPLVPGRRCSFPHLKLLVSRRRDKVGRVGSKRAVPDDSRVRFLGRDGFKA